MIELAYFFLLVIPAALILLGLVLHSCYYRGKAITAWFFGLGFLYFVLRENLVAILDHYNGMPQYFHPRAMIKLGNAPIPAVVGWLLTAYIGWYIAEKVLSNHPRLKNRLFPTLLITGIFGSSMAMAVEGTGIKLGWWMWTRLDYYYATDPFKEYLLSCPFVALQGWFFVILTFLTPFFLAFISPYRKWRAARWLWFLIIPLNGFLLTKTFDTFRFIMFGLLLILAIFSKLEFEYAPELKKQKGAQ